MLGSLISAGASLAGGFLSGSSAKDAAKQQYRNQKEFAQNSITWRAKDAERAGVSKLVGLGAPTISYSPSSVGGSDYGLSQAGQDIGRAAEAYATPVQKQGALGTEIARTQLEGLKIDNDIKRAELSSKVALRNQPGQPPAILDSDVTKPVLPGQGNSGVSLKREVVPAGATPSKSYGVSPEVDMYRTTHGWTPQVPSDLGEAMESQPLSAFQWAIRNNVLPYFSDARKTPPVGSSKTYWEYNPWTGEYLGQSRSHGKSGRRKEFKTPFSGAPFYPYFPYTY